MSKRLCFSCYGNNHVSKGCLQKRKCTKCGRRHPSALHDVRFSSPPKENKYGHNELQSQVSSSACLVTNTIEATILHAILPVTVSRKGSDKTIDTYAFYDKGSSGCFMTKDLQEELEAPGTDTLLQLRTMHGHNYVNTAVVEDLIVSDINGNNPIYLPKTYTRDEIPFNVQQIPRPEIFEQWPNLRSVASRIDPFMPMLEIGLLIGSNCPLALGPLDIMPTPEAGPYACLLRHGWTVNGPLQINSCPGSNEKNSNRILIHEVEHVKEALVPREILRMMELDFSERMPATVPDEKGYSVEDKQFIEKVNNDIRLYNGHYEVPLPFRDDNMKLPDNRIQALAKAYWQRKKILRNTSYRNDYTTLWIIYS